MGEKPTTEKAVVIRPVTYIIGLIWTVIATIFTSFVAVFTPGGGLWGLTSEAWGNSWVSQMTFMMWWPLIITTVTSFIGKALRMTKRELTIILAMVWVSWLIPSHYGILPSIVQLGTARQIPAFHKWNLGYAKAINWQFGPDPFNDKLWASWMYGGPVPWDAWMPTILWNIARLVPYYLMYAVMATLWRRQWIDVEALPFPQATGASRLVDMAYEKEEPRFLRNTFLWLGVVVGFLAIYPYWAWTIPALGVRMPVNWPSLGYDFTPLVLIPLANLNFTFEAFLIGAMFLIPVKTLFSYIVGCIGIYWIWWPMMSYMGLWEAQSAGTGGYGHALMTTMWRNYTGPMMMSWVNTWGAIAWLALGAGYGLMFAPLFITFRGELLNTLKAFVGMAPRQVDEREPMNHRLMLLAFIGLLLINVALWWQASMGALPILFALVSLLVYGGLYFMAVGRMAAEMGLVASGVNEQVFAHNWDTTIRDWWVADPNAPLYIKDLQTRFIVLKTDIPWFTTYLRAAPMSTLLESYRMGALQGVHAKYIFGATMLAVVVSVITGLFTLLQFWCTFGAVNLSIFNFTGAPNNYHQRAPTYAAIVEVGDYWRTGLGKLPVANQWILFAIGVVLISVIYFFQGKFPWFPVNAGGLALSFGWVTVVGFTPAIWAYIAKRIILRIGGVELYERKAVPFAIGMAASVGFAIILGVIFQFRVAAKL